MYHNTPANKPSPEPAEQHRQPPSSSNSSQYQLAPSLSPEILERGCEIRRINSSYDDFFASTPRFVPRVGVVTTDQPNYLGSLLETPIRKTPALISQSFISQSYSDFFASTTRLGTSRGNYFSSNGLAFGHSNVTPTQLDPSPILANEAFIESTTFAQPSSPHTPINSYFSCPVFDSPSDTLNDASNTYFNASRHSDSDTPNSTKNSIPSSSRHRDNLSGFYLPRMSSSK